MWAWRQGSGGEYDMAGREGGGRRESTYKEDLPLRGDALVLGEGMFRGEALAGDERGRRGEGEGSLTPIDQGGIRRRGDVGNDVGMHREAESCSWKGGGTRWG